MGRTAYISLDGEIDLTNAHVCVERGHRAFDAGPITRLVVDVSGVTFIDSTGLGGLVQLSNLARSRGAELYLADPTPIVARLLELSGLRAVLPVL
jgi:anti-anti-sigma factor